MLIRQITQRLCEINSYLAGSKHGTSSFEEVLPLSLFYRDFSDTNVLVREASCLAKESPETLLDLSVSLLSEADRYFSTDRASLYTTDFEALFKEHLKPFELRYEEAREAAAGLWRNYSATSNQLDFLPQDSDEYKTLHTESEAVKEAYEELRARANLLYNEWHLEGKKHYCLCCFRQMFLDVLVERLQGISRSIISDIRHMKEDKP